MMQKRSNLTVLATLATAAVAAYVLLRPEKRRHPADSAPGRTARRSRFNGYRVTGRTVTIDAPRSELYAMWRDFSKLPQFMENVRSVEDIGEGRTAWTIAAPGGEVRVETRLVEERENEALAWRSTEGSEIDTEGKVMFRDAPGGRGTLVEAMIAYRPPWGIAGHWIAKAFGREPGVQGRQELKRLKMLVETGEIATAANRKEA